jgi:hypothetical protein
MFEELNLSAGFSELSGEVGMKSLSDISEVPIVYRGKVKASQKREMILCGREKTAKDFVGKITPGFYVTGFTMGLFSLIDIIKAVIEEIGPAEVSVSTWTLGKADCTELLKLLKNGSFKNFRLLIDSTFQKRLPAITEEIRAQFGNENVIITRNHAKLLLIKNDRFHIYGETSMNLNFNPRMETISLRDDKPLYDFFDNALNLIFRHHGNQSKNDYRTALRQFSSIEF